MVLNPSICLVSFLQLLLLAALEHRPLQVPRSRSPHRTDIVEVPIPARWDVIGPFPYSSRELGADTLEAFGGILGIPRGDNATYPSELASTWGTYTGGRVGWREVNTSTDNTTVKVDFGDLRWDFLTETFGSSVQVARGWAVGDFWVNTSSMYMLDCRGVSHVILDGRNEVSTDSYRTGWRAIQPVYLEVGKHTMHIPLVVYRSHKQFSCSIKPYDQDPEEEPLQVVTRDKTNVASARPMLFSDIVAGRLAAPLGSVVVENRGRATLTDLRVTMKASADFGLTMSGFSPLLISSGQHLPLRFELNQLVEQVSCARNPGATTQQVEVYTILLTISGTVASEPSRNVSTDVFIHLFCRDIGQPYKFTFPDADESVQYAALVAPRQPCPARGCPVHFATHGASVESDPARNGAWAGAYRPPKAAWLLLPTNRDAFGFDWQMVGYENGLRALHYLEKHLPGVPSANRSEFQVDAGRILYSGHSMGGHGALLYLTHHGDRALGGVPNSGWIDFESYSFDKLRTGDSLIDPILRGILYASLAEWDADLYAPNAVGIPLIVRVGGNDSTVPPWHLRRWARLVDQFSGTPGTVTINEIPGVGHWYAGVCDDDYLNPFYTKALEGPLPELPQKFTSSTLNPSSSSGRGGIRIEQLQVPYRMARVHVDRGDGLVWTLDTENVRRLSLYDLQGRPLPTGGLVLDGTAFPAPLPTAPAHFCAMSDDAQQLPSWRICLGPEATSWLTFERSAANYGPMRQVFHTAPIVLVYGTRATDPAYNELLLMRARLVANKAYYRGRAMITLLPDTHPSVEKLATEGCPYNILVFGGPDVNDFAARTSTDAPIHWEGTTDDGTATFKVGPHSYAAGGLGYLFLYPLRASSRLALMVAGSNSGGFDLASSLVPLSSGLTAPDYLVVEQGFKWKGAAGIVAAGFYGNTWDVSAQSGYLRPFSARQAV